MNLTSSAVCNVVLEKTSNETYFTHLSILSKPSVTTAYPLHVRLPNKPVVRSRAANNHRHPQTLQEHNLVLGADHVRSDSHFPGRAIEDSLVSNPGNTILKVRQTLLGEIDLQTAYSGVCMISVGDEVSWTLRIAVGS